MYTVILAKLTITVPKSNILINKDTVTKKQER